MEMLAPGR